VRWRFWLPLIVELSGISITSAGIGIEVAMQADLGFFLISLGSLLIAFGGILWSKLKPWRKEEETYG